MLDPEYLREITVDLENYWYDVETKILADIAERISLNKNNLTSTAEYQIMIVRELGVTNDHINKYLSEALDISSREVEKIIKNSSYKAVESDNEIFNEAFKQGKIQKFNYNPENLKDLIDSGVAATTGELSNICKVTATTAQNKLLNILNSAYLQAESGAFSTDFVVEQSVSKLAKEGLDWIDYKSGMHRRLDTVIRTAVRTATNQTAAKCQEMNMDELGCNLVEVTSHLGARPDHAVWQGKIYYRKEPYGNYSNFYDATGYGTVTGLCGANCRHSFYPYFPGISEKTFKSYSLKENSELYELEQQQRYNERHIREWKRRRDVKKAAGLDVSKENAKITYWNKRNKDLIKNDDRLKHNYAREKPYKAKYTMQNNKMWKDNDKPLKKIENNRQLDYIPDIFHFSKQKELNLIDIYTDIDKKYQKDGCEHMAISDGRSGILLKPIISSGSKKSVVPDDETLYFIIDSKPKSLTLIHNHPSSSPFSITDVMTTNEYTSIKESIVINTEGEVYFLHIPSGKEVNLGNTELRDIFKNDIIKQRIKYAKKYPNLSKADVNHLAYAKFFERLGWFYGRKRY